MQDDIRLFVIEISVPIVRSVDIRTIIRVVYQSKLFDAPYLHAPFFSDVVPRRIPAVYMGLILCFQLGGREMSDQTGRYRSQGSCLPLVGLEGQC